VNIADRTFVEQARRKIPNVCACVICRLVHCASSCRVFQAFRAFRPLFAENIAPRKLSERNVNSVNVHAGCDPPRLNARQTFSSAALPRRIDQLRRRIASRRSGAFRVSARDPFQGSCRDPAGYRLVVPSLTISLALWRASTARPVSESAETSPRTWQTWGEKETLA
jgi:hypothetical protein